MSTKHYISKKQAGFKNSKQNYNRVYQKGTNFSPKGDDAKLRRLSKKTSFELLFVVHQSVQSCTDDTIGICSWPVSPVVQSHTTTSNCRARQNLNDHSDDRNAKMLQALLQFQWNESAIDFFASLSSPFNVASFSLHMATEVRYTLHLSSLNS